MEEYMVFEENEAFEVSPRNYAPLPLEYYKEMRHLSDAEFGALIRMVLYFNLTGKIPKVDGILLHYMDRVMEAQKRFNKNWNQIKEARSAAGKKSAALRKVSESNKAEQKATKLNKSNNTKSKSESKSESKSKSESQSKKIAGSNIKDGCLLPAEREREIDPVQPVVTALKSLLGIKPSEPCLSEIEDFVLRLGTDTCIYAVERAADESQCSWKYVRGILRDLERKGIRNRMQAEEDRALYTHSVPTGKITGCPSQYQTHGSTTLSELERIAIAQALAEE